MSVAIFRSNAGPFILARFPALTRFGSFAAGVFTDLDDFAIS
jgi:hypothetical protein